MTRWYVCLICGVFLFAGLSGCVEETSISPQPQQTTAVSTPPASPVATPVVVEEEPPAEVFVYVTEGRRDPFAPLTRIRRPVEVSEEPETPLQNYDINQFTLIGVIVGKGEAKAMVVAPDGKSYVLAKGVKIGKNNGEVTSITSKVILIKEKYYDFSGNIIENIQEITVPMREGV